MLSPATAARWGKQVRDGDPLEPLPSVPRKGSGKPEPFVSFFVELIEQDPDITLVELQAALLAAHDMRCSTPREYLPDFIVRIDDGRPDQLNLIVEIKGYRGEDAKEKANTMRAYWVPGVNNLGKFGRWAFAEFTAVYEIEAEFEKLIAAHLAASAPAEIEREV